MIVIDLAENFQISSASIVAGASSLIIAIFIVMTQLWHGRLTFDTKDGVQKIHLLDTPRIGGVAVYLSCWIAYWHTYSFFDETLCKILLAAAPAFAFGLLEDLTRRVSISLRLLATLLSGGFGIYVTGYTLTSLDIYLIDQLFSWALFFSYVFTILAVAGIANAFNVIDGNNGLASGLAMSGLFGVMVLAYHCGDAELVWISSIILCATFGFFVINWPWGRLFLGDGGSYLLGFIFAWLGVMLVERNGEITPFAVLLLAIYPFTEVMYSIWRRVRARQPIGAPDSLHLHSLLQKWMRLRSQANPIAINSMVGSLIVGAHTLILPLFLYVHEWPMAGISLVISYFVLYHLTYKYLLGQVSGSVNSYGN